MAKAKMNYKKIQPIAMDEWAFANLTVEEYEEFINIPLKETTRTVNGETVKKMVNDRVAMVKWLYKNHKDDIEWEEEPTGNSSRGGITLAELQKKRLEEKKRQLSK